MLTSCFRPGLTLLLFAAAAIAWAGACSDGGRACYPGDRVACSCAGGGAGTAACADGSGYGACDCSGAAVADAAQDAPSATLDAAPEAAGDGGLRAFLDTCGKNEECTTGLCFAFNAKGLRCTKTCQGDPDCPPPSTGCSNQKVCKAP